MTGDVDNFFRKYAIFGGEMMRKMRYLGVKTQKNALFLHFFAFLFGQFKKKQYLCSRFRKKAPLMGAF